MFTASRDGTSQVWDIEQQEVIRELQIGRGVLDIAVASHGHFVAYTSIDGIVRVWDIVSWQEMPEVRHDDMAWTAEFSPDGNYLATGSFDNTANNPSSHL